MSRKSELIDYKTYFDGIWSAIVKFSFSFCLRVLRIRLLSLWSCGYWQVLVGLHYSKSWFHPIKRGDFIHFKILKNMDYSVHHLCIKDQACVIEFSLHFYQLLNDIHHCFTFQDIPSECGMTVHPQIAFWFGRNQTVWN